MKIVFATNNAHKLEEIRNIMKGKYEIVSLSDIGCHEEIPEEQDTLEGNALQKARFIYEKYGCDCFADDTGLEVEALGNRPGVHSARYAGEAKNPAENVAKLLKEMEHIENRKARFRTVIAFIQSGKEQLFEGKVEGEILRELHGGDGFGYDPIFRPTGTHESFAEMSMDEKNKISHRGRAVEKLVEKLYHNTIQS
ncbi:non-canonical purine NTP pyrophosphatase [Bacteroidia bacterium]|nr:non-canonical purine NTP pyrophosphatase [Bacteroidia bacterium]